MRLCVSIAAIVAALAIPTSASAAKTGWFKVSLSGKQSFAWSIDGTRTAECEVVHGVGSGQSELKFRSTKSALVSVNSKGVAMGTFFTKESGTRTASYTETTKFPCQNLPDSPAAAAADGCGPFKANANFSLKKTKGTRTWLSPLSVEGGPLDPCVPYSLAMGDDVGQVCDYAPAAIDAGGHTSQLRPLAAFFTLKGRTMLKIKKGKKKTITATTRFDCSMPSAFPEPIKLHGEARYQLTFKRSS